ASFREPGSPFATKAILLANFLVFAYGISLTWHNSELLQAFVTGFPKNRDIADELQLTLQRSGSVSGMDILAGRWWRLLTACFVHAGIFHLGMNMYALYSIGGLT